MTAKWLSIFIIILLFPAYQYNPFNTEILESFEKSNSIDHQAEETLGLEGNNYNCRPISMRSSSWTQRSVLDFSNGTFKNVTIVGSGDQAQLMIDFPIKKGWEQKDPNSTPRLQRYNAMAQINGTDKVLLYGGMDSAYSYTNETWLYDLSDDNWTRIQPLVNFPFRLWPSITSVSGDDKVMIFGGSIGYMVFLNDTWIYDLSDNIWTPGIPDIQPRIRQNAGLAAVHGTKDIVLFGGQTDWGYNNETWVYNVTSDTWVEKSPKHSPSLRTQCCLSTIYGTDKVLLCGGIDVFQKTLNDTWVYDLSENSWSKKNTTLLPLVHPIYGDLAPIHGTDKVLLTTLFNETYTSLFFTETWIYDLSDNTWVNEKLKPKPCYAQTYAIESISGTDKVLLFTGYYNTTRNTTWVYTYSTVITNGTYVSPPYQLDQNITYKDLSWNATVPDNTTLRFQIRTGTSKCELVNQTFLGPDGEALSYYNSTPSHIWFEHNGQPWIQVIAYMNTTVEDSPMLENISISYNHWPKTVPTFPCNRGIISEKQPMFCWNFTDIDSPEQTAFQLIIDDDENFTSIDFDSGIMVSKNQTWQFPNGTSYGYTDLPDGKWYWKVRAKDSDGDWGHYSNHWTLIINTRPPSSNITHPQDGEMYRDVRTIAGVAAKAPNGTAVKYVEIALLRIKDNKYWDGVEFRREDVFWYSAVGTTNWSLSIDTNSLSYSSGEEYSVISRAADLSGNIEIPTSTRSFIIDSEPVEFLNAWPAENITFNNTKISLGVTISDETAGVNASTIEYTVSFNSGIYWGSWKSVDGLEDGFSVELAMALTFKNGTGNRIKWRASDLIGNGPTESREYLVMINTWVPPQKTPRISLWSPHNGSVLPATLVKLSWNLQTQDLIDVVYDIYLDTVDPPKTIIKQNEDNTSLFIQDMEDGQRYYWTVIPKYGDFTGTCISGVWWFGIDVPKPRVNLTTPKNGSMINSPKPTLVWSLDYKGSENITYDLYFGADQKPELRFEKLNIHYFSIMEPLDDNTTYYWYVVPWADQYIGISSELWSFTVKSVKEEINIFKLNLTLQPQTIELEPGMLGNVTAKVSNLGTSSDTVSLEFKIPPDQDVGVIVNSQNRLELPAGADGVFNLTVVATVSALDGTVVKINVVAYSRIMGYQNVSVNSERIMTITIKKPAVEETEPEVDKKDTDTQTSVSFNNMLILLMIVIVLVIILIYLLARRKKKDGQHSDETKITDQEDQEE